MSSSVPERGRSAPFDFDRLIGPKPEARQAAAAAEVATAVGELVRRVRTAEGVTQSELEWRTGITQAHISELERGLGCNGPTVVTLSRIMTELGDQAVIDTAKERAAREAVQIEEAKSWAVALLQAAVQEPAGTGMSVMQALENAVIDGARANDQEEANPFKRVFAHGILFGAHLSQQFAASSEKLVTDADVVRGLREGRDLFSRTITVQDVPKPESHRGASAIFPGRKF